MVRILAACVVILSVVSGIQRLAIREQRKSIDALEERVASQSAALDSLTALSERRHDVWMESAERMERLERAMADAQEWASCRLPADVAECLCDGEDGDTAKAVVGALRPVEDLR